MLNILRRVALIEPNLRVTAQLNRIQKFSTERIPLAIRKKKGKSKERSVCRSFIIIYSRISILMFR